MLLSSGEFFAKIYSLKKNFPPCFLCFIFHILLPKINEKVIAGRERSSPIHKMCSCKEVSGYMDKSTKIFVLWLLVLSIKVKKKNKEKKEHFDKKWVNKRGRPVALAVRWSIQTLTWRVLHLRVIWKKKEGRREQPKIFGSRPFQKPYRLWKRKSSLTSH